MNLDQKFCSLCLSLPDEEEIIKDVLIGKEGRIRFKTPISCFSKIDPDVKKDITQKNVDSMEIFYVDLCGSLIVRKYLSVFVSLFGKIDYSNYCEKILSYNHLHFSLEKSSSNLEWTFHISFLHDLIVNSFLCAAEDVE